MGAHPIYQISDLVHYYGAQKVLDIESLDIGSGAIVGLVGPNGSGKSTFLRILGFIDKPTQGNLFFQGKKSEPFSPNVRFNVALLPQDAYLMKRSVARNIAYGLSLRGIKSGLEEQIRKALDWVGLPAKQFAKRQWNELSGGEAQRVALAARLALKPKVLILDEPTANVDVNSSQLIKAAALTARQRYGTTLIVASHDRDWLDETSDEIICLFKGRITGKARDNIIFGPFQKGDNGYLEKKLSDGQKLVLSGSQLVSAAACIDPDAVLITPTDAAASIPVNRLKGTICRLSMTGKQQRMIVTLRMGDLSLAVRMEMPHLKRQSLYPGQLVLVEIPQKAVNWIQL